MLELTLLEELAKIIQSYGVVGVIVLFVAFLVWQERRRAERETTDRLERQKSAEADRLVLTNHLSMMIKEDSESRENLAVGLTKLAESVNNFQTRCGQIQNNLQNEVDRLMKR